jgi:hypothetical protein
MSHEAHVFRPGFLQSLWITSLSAAIGVVLAAPFLCFTLQAYMFFAVLVYSFPLYALFMTILVVWYSKTTILPTSIRGYSALGTFQTVDWEQMEYISPIRLFGLRYLRIYTKNGRWALWLPLFHLNQQQLEQLVLSYVPQEHVLRLHFPSTATPNA